MKKFLILLTAAIMNYGPTALAVPQLVNYQGYLTATDGTPLDSTVSVVFTIYDAESGGVVQWTEAHASVTVTDGLFHVLLGSVTPLADLFNANRWLGVTVGSDAEMSPRQQIVSVAHAYRVGTVDGASGGSISGNIVVSGKACIGPGSTNAGTNALAVGQNNSASGNNATVAGGMFNTGSGYLSFIGGGDENEVNNQRGVIGGGYNNTVSGDNSVISGGESNTITAGASIIGGGGNNSVTQQYAVVGGGRHNSARGQYSVIAGGGGASLADSNSALGDYSAVGGGRRNTATNAYASVGGGYGNAASSQSSTVGGGKWNKARGDYSVIAGGGSADEADSNSVLGPYSVISGGYRNIANAGSGVIGGGAANTLGPVFAPAICGGSGNTASGAWAYIGGGYVNSSTADKTTVGGGELNVASEDWATVAGGYDNHATNFEATVAGGGSNWATGEYSAVAGGLGCQATGFAAHIGGGRYNRAAGDYSVVAGGGGAAVADSNSARGAYAMIPGGTRNLAAGNYSFAAGRRAKANYAGSFVWGDSTNADIADDAANQFRVRASGGTWFYSNSTHTSGVRLAAGGNTWLVISDSTRKRNIRLVDTKEVLEKVSQLPIKQWSYISQDPSIEHIGPMAQDFWNLFHIGDDSLSISTIDPGGIALAAIQGLYKEVIELRARVQTLEAANQKALKEDK